MLVRMILAFSAILLLARPGTAEDCRTLEFGAREALLRRAPTCDKAMELFGACNAGGSGDVNLGRIVTEKCEARFLQKLSAAQRRTYDQEMKSCNDEEKEDEGTLSRAMAAGCRAVSLPETVALADFVGAGTVKPSVSTPSAAPPSGSPPPPAPMPR